ncbi:hypothetical protein P9X10_00980 [Bacillus cereus]|nr:hypothetical protein [Bacillus cereus]
MMVYIGLYLMGGAIYTFLTRNIYYNRIVEETGQPVGTLLVLTFFWLPMEARSWIKNIINRIKNVYGWIKSWFIYTIGDLKRDLEKDSRLEEVNGEFIQLEDFCLNCQSTENTVQNTVDVMDDEEDGHVFFQVTYFICKDCSDRKVDVLDAIEHKKKM